MNTHAARALLVLICAPLLPLAYWSNSRNRLDVATICLDLAVAGWLMFLAVSWPRPRHAWCWGSLAASWTAGSVWPEVVDLHRGMLVLAAIVTSEMGLRHRTALGLAVLCGALLASPTTGPVAASGLFLVTAAALRTVRPGGPLAKVAATSLAAVSVAELAVAVTLRLDAGPSSVGPGIYMLSVGAAATWLWIATAERERLVEDLTSSTTPHDPDVLTHLGLALASALDDESVRVRAVGEGRAVLVEGQPWCVVSSRAGWLDDEETWRSVHDAIARVGQRERLLALERRQIEELSASRARLVDAADRERAAMGTVLRHDVIAPLAAAARLARPDYPAIAHEINQTVEDVEAVVRGVPSVRLGGGALARALPDLARRCPLPVEVQVSDGAWADEPVETALYAVCAEAITNAMKHSRATSVSITLGAVGDELQLRVRDNGCGHDEHPDAAGSGLAGLSERVRAIGGRLSVNGSSHGTDVLATVPLGAT